MAKKKEKIPLGDQSKGFSDNPFAALAQRSDLPAPEPSAAPTQATDVVNVDLSKKRVHFNIEKKGRAGKTVTLVGGLECTPEQLERIAATVKKALSVGVTVEDERLVVQGDQRARMPQALAEFGYKEKK
jgi:translation initiation factor 1